MKEQKNTPTGQEVKTNNVKWRMRIGKKRPKKERGVSSSAAAIFNYTHVGY
jgi:hypothetical protein